MLTTCCTLFAGGRSVHYAGDIWEGDLTRVQRSWTMCASSPANNLGLPLPPSNDSVAVADRAIRNEFPDAPCQIARGFHPSVLAAKAHGPWSAVGGHEPVASEGAPNANIVPLSVDEVARFWSSFRSSRDLAIVGLMLLKGSAPPKVLALNRDDALLSEAQLRVPGKGNKFRSLPLAPETVQLLEHYLRLERPNPVPPRSSSHSKATRAEHA